MNNPPYLWVFMLYVSFTVASIFIWLVSSSLRQSGKSQTSGKADFAVTAITVFGWLAIAGTLGFFGLFRILIGGYLPSIILGICLPILVGCWFMFGSNRGAALVRDMPQEWMIGIQAYRGLGAIFLVLNGLNQLPSEFAIPAGFGDVTTGILAIPVAAYYGSASPFRKLVAVVWNVFGFADLVAALTLGFLTSPSPFQLLALDHPNFLVGQFPLVLIPVFAVPISILLHIASLKKLVTEK